MLTLVLLTGCGKGDVTNNVDDTAKDELIMAIGSEPEGGFDPCNGWDDMVVRFFRAL